MTQPLTDLEMFELLRACYPDRFSNEEDETFDAAMNFAEEVSGFRDLADLLGRVAMLTLPMVSAISGRLCHCLGPVECKSGDVEMMAVVRRDVVEVRP
jgi:hypothetical protein